MIIRHSTATLIEQQGYDIESMEKFIEAAGRTCYKSENKITETSAGKFVADLITRGHTAMLEHGPVYLKVPASVHNSAVIFSFFDTNPFSRVAYVQDDENWYAISTNYRVLVENELSGYLIFMCAPTEYHDKRLTVRFVTDRGVTHELVRHRVFSFAQESTRFCNYGQSRFGEELTYIIPHWLPNLPEGHVKFSGNYVLVENDTEMHQCNELESVFLNQLQSAEDCYMDFVTAYENRKPDRRYKTGYKGNPLTPQQARQVLPNALKSEIVLTAFTSDWKHFFDLRYKGTTGTPHEDMLELTNKIVPILQSTPEHPHAPNTIWEKIYPIIKDKI